MKNGRLGDRQDKRGIGWKVSPLQCITVKMAGPEQQWDHLNLFTSSALQGTATLELSTTEIFRIKTKTEDFTEFRVAFVQDLNVNLLKPY